MKSERADEITAAVESKRQAALTADPDTIPNNGGLHSAVVKAIWDGCTADERADYDLRALENAGNIDL